MGSGYVVRFKAGVALSSWPLWFIWAKDCPQTVTLLFDCPGACARRQSPRPNGTEQRPGAPTRLVKRVGVVCLGWWPELSGWSPLTRTGAGGHTERVPAPSLGWEGEGLREELRGRLMRMDCVGLLAFPLLGCACGEPDRQAYQGQSNVTRLCF